jgi:hypothetical protein
MSAQIIPLTPSPNQTITPSLFVDGTTLVLNLKIYFNEQMNFWVMDIADQNNNPLVSSVPLEPGVWPAANVLRPYTYLKIGSAFLMDVSGSPYTPSSSSLLGTQQVLLWDDTPTS